MRSPFLALWGPQIALGAAKGKPIEIPLSGSAWPSFKGFCAEKWLDKHRMKSTERREEGRGFPSSGVSVCTRARARVCEREKVSRSLLEDFFSPTLMRPRRTRTARQGRCTSRNTHKRKITTSHTVRGGKREFLRRGIPANYLSSSCVQQIHPDPRRCPRVQRALSYLLAAALGVVAVHGRGALSRGGRRRQRLVFTCLQQGLSRRRLRSRISQDLPKKP